jgi:hypothetical protein
LLKAEAIYQQVRTGFTPGWDTISANLQARKGLLKVDAIYQLNLRWKKDSPRAEAIYQLKQKEKQQNNNSTMTHKD